MAIKKKPEDKILEVLAKLKECNINTLRRETGLSYYTLVKTLNILISKGLVVEKRIRRARIIRMIENP